MLKTSLGLCQRLLFCLWVQLRKLLGSVKCNEGVVQAMQPPHLYHVFLNLFQEKLLRVLAERENKQKVVGTQECHVPLTTGGLIYFKSLNFE